LLSIDALLFPAAFGLLGTFLWEMIMAFLRADQSPWAILANAHLKFLRITEYGVDPATGDEKPIAWESAEGRAYFSKASVQGKAFESGGVPIGSYKVQGYTVGILPDWANEAINQKVECEINHLGKGYFYYQGKISVVRDQVEAAGVGTPIQGYFTRQGT
jgi:hypothetical protein